MIHARICKVPTLSTVPTGYPNVQISPDSSTSFRVTWSEIPVSERRGKITNHKLSYGVVKMVTVVQLPADSKEYLVTGG